MKGLFLTLAIFAAMAASAQGLQPVNPTGSGATASEAPVVTTLNYRIDFIRPDSFYLVEVKTITETPGKRGKTEEESVFLKDTAQIRFIIEKSIEQEKEFERKLNEYRAMRTTVTELYATLRERIKNRGNQ